MLKAVPRVTNWWNLELSSLKYKISVLKIHSARSRNCADNFNALAGLDQTNKLNLRIVQSIKVLRFFYIGCTVFGCFGQKYFLQRRHQAHHESTSVLSTDNARSPRGTHLNADHWTHHHLCHLFLCHRLLRHHNRSLRKEMPASQHWKLKFTFCLLFLHYVKSVE